jgi:hypothetical protein
MEQNKESLTVENVKEKAGEWCKKFFTMPVEPLSKPQSMTLLQCFMAESKKAPIPTEVTSDFGFRVLDGRAKHVGLEITDWAALFLTSMCTSPGEAVMYTHALKSLGQPVNMGSLCETFPMGFLTKESLRTMWSEQKCSVPGCDNTLDLCH